ncbi:spore gernimation protein GerB [Alkalihalophilus pseudofirmus]|uniref:GerAB/ArcD/ProY family transporter n=1 Tax=Alkalihalophilus pseudofirmus TaxID=79885 RepID=UPI0009529756|nr:spore gernimation protein GerB [Alkalihalophilus pseudofirmus]
MDKPIKEQYLVSGFLVFFLIHGMQIGIGILGFQRGVVKEAGYDAWISVIGAGIFVHLIIFCIYLLVKRSNGDLISIHQQLFGKWVGNTLSFIVCVYFICLASIVMRAYIEIIQVWMFIDLPTWVMALIGFGLFYYVVAGGFRSVVGLAFLGVIIPIPLFLILLMPLEFAHFINLVPVFKHTLVELALGAKETTLSFLGFEILLLYYPFLKNRQFTQKWAQLGASTTTFVYTVVMLISLAFYSEEQLNKTIWATLSLFKVVQLPFLERFEYIGVALWVLFIAPNIALALWAASRGAKRIFQMNQRIALFISLVLVTVIMISLPTRQEISLFADWVSTFGFYFVFAYIPFLVIIQTVLMKVKKGRGDHEKTTSM